MNIPSTGHVNTDNHRQDEAIFKATDGVDSATDVAGECHGLDPHSSHH